jgi:hypothetical protein
MDMHRCLPVLHKSGMGAGKTPDELEKERPLVIGARVWLAVSLSWSHVVPMANFVAHQTCLRVYLIETGIG